MMNDYGESEKILLMKLAKEAAKDSSCVSRQVGVILMLKDHHILITGVNEMVGTTCGEEKSCRCFDPNRIPGKDLDKCYASHAELKAVGYAAKHGYSTKGAYAIVTDLPCNECAKALIEAGVKHVIYDRDYPDSKALWLFDKAGVTYEQYTYKGDFIYA